MQISRFRTLAVAFVLLAQPGPFAGASETAVGTDARIGDYLSARMAAFEHRFDQAAAWLSAVDEAVPESPQLLRNLLLFQIGSGDLEGAIDAARRLNAFAPGTDETVINTLAVGDFAKGDFNSALERYLDSELELGPAFLTILKGWTHFSDGDAEAAYEVLEAHDPNDQLLPFVKFHQALIQALHGEYARADETVLSIPDLPNPEKFMPATLIGELLVLRVHLLAAQDLHEEAELISGLTPGGVPELTSARLSFLNERLREGETFGFHYSDGAGDGISRFISEIGRSFARNGNYDAALVWARFAQFLNPNDTALSLEVADIFQNLESWEMARAVQESVPEDDPLFGLAEIGRAESLYRLDRTEDALEAFEKLIASPGVDAEVHLALGNIHSRESNYEQALVSFDAAIELIEEGPDPQSPGSAGRPRSTSDWLAYYYRAIALERLGRWRESKVDFHRALVDSEHNPYVLNYLGYTLADKNEELDEARQLISEAVEQMPDNGAFVDSLGWVLYRLGEYDEAVTQMERAIRLEPQDPVVMDHLGDVYWMVDRKREAVYQWQRALAYTDDNNEYVDEARIMRKLEVGLDEVLAAEGLNSVADD